MDNVNDLLAELRDIIETQCNENAEGHRLVDDLEAAIDARRREVEAASEFKPTHRHYKGGLYQLLHRANVEADLRDLIVYRDAVGIVWVRDSVEFYATLPDGRARFETIAPENGS